MADVTPEQIAAAGPWMQTVRFPCGVDVGRWDDDLKMSGLTAGVEITGRSVLDIGCMAGVDTLWLWRRGAARLLCVDNESGLPLTRPQFELVQRAFGLPARREEKDLLELGPEYSSDIVLLAGVYYHLRNALLGIERAWALTREVLLVEGAVIEDERPIALFCKDEYDQDPTNWWIPSRRCLLDWCESLPGQRRVRDVTAPGYDRHRMFVQVWR